MRPPITGHDDGGTGGRIVGRRIGEADARAEDDARRRAEAVDRLQTVRLFRLVLADDVGVASGRGGHPFEVADA